MAFIYLFYQLSSPYYIFDIFDHDFIILLDLVDRSQSPSVSSTMYKSWMNFWRGFCRYNCKENNSLQVSVARYDRC